MLRGWDHMMLIEKLRELKLFSLRKSKWSA